MLHSEKPPQWEAHESQLESGSHSPQLEKAHMQQLKLSTAKNKFKNLGGKYDEWPESVFKQTEII